MARRQRIFSSSPRDRAEERARDMAKRIRSFNRLSQETRTSLGVPESKAYPVRHGMSDAALYRISKEMRDTLTRINLGLATASEEDMARINYAISHGYRPSEEVLTNTKLKGDFRTIFTMGTDKEQKRLRALYRDIERIRNDERTYSVSKGTSIEDIYRLISAYAEGIRANDEE